VIFALLAGLILINALYVVHLDRKDKRVDAQVNRLLQRIQAPERAVVEFSEIHPTEGPVYSNEWIEEQENLEALFKDDE
jgi:hypothetical protein